MVNITNCNALPCEHVEHVGAESATQCASCDVGKVMMPIAVVIIVITGCVRIGEVAELREQVEGVVIPVPGFVHILQIHFAGPVIRRTADLINQRQYAGAVAAG